MPDPYIDPTCTALLVIDMQKGFCDPESQMEKAGLRIRPVSASGPARLECNEGAR